MKNLQNFILIKIDNYISKLDQTNNLKHSLIKNPITKLIIKLFFNFEIDSKNQLIIISKYMGNVYFIN